MRRSWRRSLYLVGALAAMFVAVSAITQAIRQDSWEPVITAAFIPAVIVATWPGTYRRCLIRRNRRAG